MTPEEVKEIEMVAMRKRIAKIPTSVLVAELESREGVDLTGIPDGITYGVTVDGPCKILVVKE